MVAKPNAVKMKDFLLKFEMTTAWKDNWQESRAVLDRFLAKNTGKVRRN